MKPFLHTLFFALITTIGQTQVLYNPQVLYDNSNGLFHIDSLRTINLVTAKK